MPVLRRTRGAEGSRPRPPRRVRPGLAPADADSAPRQRARAAPSFVASAEDFAAVDRHGRAERGRVRAGIAGADIDDVRAGGRAPSAYDPEEVDARLVLVVLPRALVVDLEEAAPLDRP